MFILSEASFLNLSSNFLAFFEFFAYIYNKELLFSHSPTMLAQIIASNAYQRVHQHLVSGGKLSNQLQRIASNATCPFLASGFCL
jgi:hypothetical protein